MFPIITLQSLTTWNENIFNGIKTLPDIDTDVLIDTIMMNYGDRQALYPDANAMEHAVNMWAKRWMRNIARLWRVNVVEYNPIWNKDGTIKEVRTPDIIKQNDTSGEAQSDTKGEATTENDRQGFNSDEFNPVTRDKSTDKGQTASKTKGLSIETEKGTETIVRTEGGNIGVTKTQEMIKDEWDLWAVNNFYNTVAAIFAREFVVAIF